MEAESGLRDILQSHHLPPSLQPLPFPEQLVNCSGVSRPALVLQLRSGLEFRTHSLDQRRSILAFALIRTFRSFWYE